MDSDHAVDQALESNSIFHQLGAIRENPNAGSLMARVRQRFNEQRIARSAGSIGNDGDLSGPLSADGSTLTTDMDQNIIVTRELLWDVLSRLTDNRSAVMKQAEGELFSLEPQPGYYSSLFEILLSPEVQNSISNEHQAVRLMIAIILRKDVERHWAAGGNRMAKSHKLTDNIKSEIRARIVDACLSEQRNETSRTVADIIAKIARHDIPELWDSLIEGDLLKRLSVLLVDVDRAISESNLVAVTTAVELFARCAFLLERVVKSVASKRFIKHRAFFTNMPNQLFDPVGGTWISLLEKCRMFVDVNDAAKQREFASVQSRLLDAALSLTKLLHHIIVFGASVQLRDAARIKDASPELESGDNESATFAATTNLIKEKLLSFFQLVYAVENMPQPSVYDKIRHLRRFFVQKMPASSQRIVCETILKRLDKIVSRVIQNVGLTESINAFLPIILQRYQKIAFGGEHESEISSTGSLHQSLIILSSVITNAPTSFGAKIPQSTIYRCQLVADAFPEHLIQNHVRCLIRYATLDDASRERLEENAEEFAIHSAPLEALNIDLRTSAQYCLARLTKLRSEAVLQALFTLLTEPMMPVQNAVDGGESTVAASAFRREALYSLVMCIKPQLFDYIGASRNSALLVQLHCKLHQDLHELLQLHNSLPHTRKRSENCSDADDDEFDENGLAVVLVCHRIVMTYGEYFFMPANDADFNAIRAALVQLQSSSDAVAASSTGGDSIKERLLDHYQLLLHALSRRIAPPVLVRLAAVDVLQRRVFGDPKWTDAAHLAPHCHEMLNHMEQLISDCASSEAREFVLSTVRSMVLAFRETAFPVPSAHTINLCRTTLCLNTNNQSTMSTKAANRSVANKRFDGSGDSAEEARVKSDISDIQLQTKLSVTQALYLVLQDSVMSPEAVAVDHHITFLMSDLVEALIVEALKPLANEGFAEEALVLYRELLKRMPSHEYMPSNTAAYLLDAAIRYLLQQSSSSRLSRQLPKQIAELLLEYALLLPQYCAHNFGPMMVEWFLNILRDNRPISPNGDNIDNDKRIASGSSAENYDTKQTSLTRDEQIVLVESLSTLVLLFAASGEQQASPILQVSPDLLRFVLYQSRAAANASFGATRVNETKQLRLNVANVRGGASSQAKDSVSGVGKEASGGRFGLDILLDILCARVLYTTPIPLILHVIRESCVIPAVELFYAEHYYGAAAVERLMQVRKAAENEQRLQQGSNSVYSMSSRLNSVVTTAVKQVLSAAGSGAGNAVQQLDETQMSDLSERVLICVVQILTERVKDMERYAGKWVVLNIIRLLDDNIGRVNYMSTFLLHFLNEVMLKQVRACPRKRSPEKPAAAGAASVVDSRQILPDTLMLDLVEKISFHPEQATTPGERRRIELVDSNDPAYRIYTPGVLFDVLRRLRRQYGENVFQLLLQCDAAATAPNFGTFTPFTSNSAVNTAMAFQMSAAALAPLIEYVLSEPVSNNNI